MDNDKKSILDAKIDEITQLIGDQSRVDKETVILQVVLKGRDAVLYRILTELSNDAIEGKTEFVTKLIILEGMNACAIRLQSEITTSRIMHKIITAMGGKDGNEQDE